MLSIAGEALSIAGAMAERNSSIRGTLLGVGGGMPLAAVIDLIRHSASAAPSATAPTEGPPSHA